MYRDWLLWQLVDSAFPTGGFAHSSGLEAAKQAGQIGDESDLVEFAEVVLQQTIDTVLPYMVGVYHEPELLTTADNHCDAFLVNPVANRASRSQGSGLLMAASSAFPQPEFIAMKKLAKQQRWPGHLAPWYGWIFSRLQIPLVDANRSVLYVSLRSVLSAAVRLNIVGPLRSQALQYDLGDVAARLLQRDVGSFHQVAQTAPVLDVWQSSHDRLYSRLFHS